MLILERGKNGMVIHKYRREVPESVQFQNTHQLTLGLTNSNYRNQLIYITIMPQWYKVSNNRNVSQFQ